LEREHLPLAQRFGLGVIPWSPLAGGFLTGKYRPEVGAPEGSRLGRWKQWYTRYDTPRTWAMMEVLNEVAAQAGASQGQVALAWLLSRPAVTSVIFGARSLEQLEDNLPAGDLTLSAEAIRRLDEASAVDHGYPYTFISRIQNPW
jgi:aryl-alcohol dehydrogenase-like predicted oxidoreductase